MSNPTKPPHIGAAEVFTCDWEYECPRDWFTLATTDNPRVRHCEVCSKPVTFCENAGDMLDLLRESPGACVALHSQKVQVVTLNRRRMTMGLPRGHAGKNVRLFEELDEELDREGDEAESI